MDAKNTMIGGWHRLLAVELKVDSIKGSTFIGKIKRTTGELDKRTRTLRVEAEVKDEKSQLRPGMYGTIVVTTG